MFFLDIHSLARNSGLSNDQKAIRAILFISISFTGTCTLHSYRSPFLCTLLNFAVLKMIPSVISVILNLQLLTHCLSQLAASRLDNCILW